MGKVVSILHYSSLPVIGGVEFIIDKHSKLLKRDGFQVNIITGEGKPDKLIPELKASYYKKINGQILKGKSPSNFQPEVKKLKTKILKAISASDLLIVHNLLTMHFNLVATAAVLEISRKIKTISWTHDISYKDSTYDLPPPVNSPIELISKPAPGIKWVTITNSRRKLLSNFFKLPKSEITVIPNGIDPYKILPDNMRKTAKKLRILSYYPVAIFPSRLTRRKNFELAIDITSHLKGKPLLLLSAPPDPHNPSFASYKTELINRAKEKGTELILFAEHCPIRNIEPFYFLGDFLLITSKMEGFGLPAIEASLFRLPTAVSDIAELKEIGKNFKSHIFFDLEEKPEKIAKKVTKFLNDCKTVHDRRTVINNYSWEAILEKRIKPLLRAI